MSLPVRSIGFALALAGLVGCSGAPGEGSPEGETLGRAETPIAGGYSDTKDTSIVGVLDFVQGFLCSGSLIAPNVVLTAHHCVANLVNGVGPTGEGVDCSITRFSATTAATNFGVTTLSQFSMNQGDYHAVVEVLTAPNPPNSVCGADQAILILADDIKPAEAPLLVPRVDTPIAPQDLYNAVGYGGTDNNGTGAGQRRRRDMLHVECVGNACGQSFAVKAGEWIGETGICQGDSGGPAVDAESRVIGVTSRGGAGCTMPVYGYVFSQAAWIQASVLHGAKLGGYAPPAWATGYPTDPAYSEPVGGACKLPADCPSNRCVNDGTSQYCTRLCDAQAPCPTGYTCDASTSVCFEVYPPKPVPTTPTPVRPSRPRASNNASGNGSGCSVEPLADPTKPIPWAAGLALGALGVLRRRRR